MDRIRIDIDLKNFYLIDECLSKWSPTLDNVIKIENKTTRKLISLLFEYTFGTEKINGLFNYLSEIDLNIFNKNCEESYNILLGKKDFLLENGKTSSYYTETILGGIELFLMMFNNPDLVEKYYPYEFSIIRDKKIDSILKN